MKGNCKSISKRLLTNGNTSKGTRVNNSNEKKSGGKINGRIEHQYIEYLRKAKRRSEGTIRKMEASLAQWKRITKDRDYKKPLNANVIIDFTDKLRKDSGLSHSSVKDNLIQLRQFFFWLSDQPGFKRSINKSYLEYFSLTPEEKYCHLNRIPRDYPTHEQVKTIIESIRIETFIDMRDQAMIAFMFLTGVRVTALSTLKIGSYIPETKRVEQNPAMGVKTKYAKHISGRLFDFDEGLTKIVNDWHQLLIESRYSLTDPLFPAAEPNKVGLVYTKSQDLSHQHISSSRIRVILEQRCIEAGLPAFNPHSLRHGLTALAWTGMRDGMDIKALSQTLGHEKINLLLTTYGNLPFQTLDQSIRNIENNIKKVQK